MPADARADVRCVSPASTLLGEGPLWDGAGGAVFWVDIKNGTIHRRDAATGDIGSVALGVEVGCIALRRAGGLVAALRSGFAFVDWPGGGLQPIHDPEADLPGNRFNDGACDARGRLWAGTMDDGERNPAGALYCLESDGRVRRLRDGYVVSNGIGWSPDGGTMYFTDSARRTIWAFDFDVDAGDLAGDRPFARLADDDGYPDGLAVDAEGFVWSAVWDGGRLVRFDPDGRIEREVAVPVPRPTSLAFGGANLDTMYVSSARVGLDAAALDAFPLSGALFQVEAGIRGRLEPRFAG